MTDLMNELMNDEAVYRTAPATPGLLNICLTTTDPCLPIIAQKCNDAYYSWSSQFVPSNPIGQHFLFICLSLAVWLCLKKCSENKVLAVLLQIGAKDLTV